MPAHSLLYRAARFTHVSHLLAAFLLSSWGLPALAQSALRIDITGVGARQIPVAVAPFESAETDTKFASTVASVIRANLIRSGVISIVDAGTPAPTLSDRSDIAPLFQVWKARGADALVVGSATSQPDGRVEARFILLDNNRAESLGGLSITSPATDLDARRTGHRISDFIYEKLTGEPGFFASRLAFVRKEKDTQTLLISDSDGQNTQVALRSREPLISLAWSPDGTRLAYVSFESGKPVVYVHTLSTGKRIAVANERGSNSAPAWSPDGKQLAVVLTRDGFSQVYVVNAEGGGLRRVTRSSGIDTEPAFSADGKFIYFTSDRGGAPQIYRTSLEGGEAQRVTFSSGFNARPQISPDGKSMVYVTRRDREFRIAVMNLSTQQETLIGTGPKDDSPSFAPNSRWVIYSGRYQGRQILTAVSLDGKFRTRLSSEGGDIRGPAWGRLP